MIHINGVKCSRFRAFCNVIYFILHQALCHTALSEGELKMLCEVAKKIIKKKEGSLFLFPRHSLHSIDIDIRHDDKIYEQEHAEYFCKTFFMLAYIY